MENAELLKVLIKAVDAVNDKLDKIDERLRVVESSISESKGRHSGLMTTKDVIIVIAAVGALVLSFFRLTQG